MSRDTRPSVPSPRMIRWDTVALVAAVAIILVFIGWLFARPAGGAILNANPTGDTDVRFPLDLFVGLGVTGFALIMGGIGGIYYRLRKLETANAVDKAVTESDERHRSQRMSSLEGEVSNMRADMRGELGKVHGRIDGLHALLVSQHQDRE